jgi:hypothetical protein
MDGSQAVEAEEITVTIRSRQLGQPPDRPPPGPPLPSTPPPGALRRRRLLGALVAAPAVLATGRLAVAGLRAVPAVRPQARGSSAQRCAQCGSSQHTMLDPACPASPGVI